MTSTTKISLLLIDDKLSFGQAFMLQHDDEFTVYHELYLSAAEQKLRSDFYNYDFVILDGLGHTVEGLAEDRGEDKHAYLGLKLISELSSIFGRKLPCCVYTAYLSDSSIKLLQEVNTDLRVFEKGPGEAAMLQYIREEYARGPEATFRMKHPEIAKAFQNQWLTHDIEQDLIKLFGEMEVATPSDAKHAARRVRVIMEAVYIKIAQTSPSVLPNELTTNNDLALSNAIWKVAGQPSKDNNFNPPHAAMPIPLYNMVSSLQRATSRSAMHHYSSPISRYSLASYANILADLLLWFSNFMQKRA